MPATDRNRWLVLSVFLLSTAINYLDRQTLNSVAPLILSEFHMTRAQFGWLATGFSIAYSAGAPLAGMMIDRLGLTRGISLSIGVWSIAGILTGLSRGMTSLVAWRTLLGVAEAGGIPAAGKAIQRFLRPEERAFGNSLNQVAVSLGIILAPPLSLAIGLRWDWRAAFVVTGLLGLFWIPLWRWIEPRGGEPEAKRARWTPEILRDRRVWLFAGANAVSMVLYSLWTTWTVLFLSESVHVPLAEAGWYAAIPPVFATAGGLAGGWASYRAMKTGLPAIPARLRACLAASLLALVTGALPWAHGAIAATAGISVSFFAVSAFSVNMYSMPLDVFAPRHAAFAISLLTSSYGAMQAIVSPIIGAVIDGYGYGPVCVAASLTPLAAYAILRWADPQP